ncbi:hypothetical protein CEXT_781971 [Caerostris extrusa]|uniref:Uncharacterized protein n=1 Tax=Caerostris extrusa TaxID=172846 RepID=A0AAV4VFT1_CAEEX|nr:hypothetical protein CEXT_781971 [Caerostris extrusa]
MTNLIIAKLLVLERHLKCVRLVTRVPMCLSLRLADGKGFNGDTTLSKHVCAIVEWFQKERNSIFLEAEKLDALWPIAKHNSSFVLKFPNLRHLNNATELGKILSVPRS